MQLLELMLIDELSRNAQRLGCRVLSLKFLSGKLHVTPLKLCGIGTKTTTLESPLYSIAMTVQAIRKATVGQVGHLINDLVQLLMIPRMVLAPSSSNANVLISTTATPAEAQGA